LKIEAKKVVFVVSSGKKQISPLLAPPRKIWKNPLVPPPGKNLSDAHVPLVYICQHLYFI